MSVTFLFFEMDECMYANFVQSYLFSLLFIVKNIKTFNIVIIYKDIEANTLNETSRNNFSFIWNKFKYKESIKLHLSPTNSCKIHLSPINVSLQNLTNLKTR